MAEPLAPLSGYGAWISDVVRVEAFDALGNETDGVVDFTMTLGAPLCAVVYPLGCPLRIPCQKVTST